MEEPTVEIHSEERPINENEKETSNSFVDLNLFLVEAVSEVRDKTMTQDDSPIQPYRRSSTSTEPQRPRRFASPVNRMFDQILVILFFSASYASTS